MHRLLNPHATASAWFAFAVVVHATLLIAGEPAQPVPFKHSGVLKAWTQFGEQLTFGKGQTLALVDDGCTLSRPEWSMSDGDEPKVLVTYDSVDGDDDPKHEGRGYPLVHHDTKRAPTLYNRHVRHVCRGDRLNPGPAHRPGAPAGPWPPDSSTQCGSANTVMWSTRRNCGSLHVENKGDSNI